MNLNGTISGKTRLLGLIGNPVEHTVSPQLHNTLASATNIDVAYVPFHVEKEKLEAAVKGLMAVNVLGFNVTVPYKKDIIKYLDECSKEALLMGSVNTVKNIDGRFYGYNTDAEGFSKSFKHETGTGFKGKQVFIIGAGGAARAISVKIAKEGAGKIYIANRTPSKALEIADMVNENVSSVAEHLDISDARTSKVFSSSGIIINTTTVGMYPNMDVSPIEASFVFSKEQIVYDVIYNPKKTRLLTIAEEKGCTVVNGIGMLFYQGVSAFEIWTGIKLQEPFLSDFYNSFKKVL